jgi:uncharacterized protein (TIGR04255 family)
MEPRRLENAPIVEALLDLRVRPTDAPHPDLLEGLRAALGDDFPISKPRHRVTQEVDPEAEDLPPATREIDAWLFHAADKRRVLTAGRQGMTLSILPTYKNWEELRDATRDLWEKYLAVAQPNAVTRIGARFINRIEIPLPIPDLKDWFATYLEVGSSLPQNLTDYFFRLVLPLERGVGIITQLLQSPTSENRLPFILDVDAFIEAEYEPGGGRLWDAIEELRAAKNKLFFGSITERTAELFK